MSEYDIDSELLEQSTVEWHPTEGWVPKKTKGATRSSRHASGKRTRTTARPESKRRPGSKVFSGMLTKETPEERFCRQFSIATAMIATGLFLITFVARRPELVALTFLLYIASGVAYSFTRRAKWNRLRKFVYRRSGYTCERCGITGVRLVAHHITPRYVGGQDTIENLTCLCENCHAEIHPWLKQR